MTTSISFQIEYDKNRETYAFVLADTPATLIEFAPAMLRAHQGLQDWILSDRPILIIPVKTTDGTGGVFRTTTLISPAKIPNTAAKILCFNAALGKLIAPNESKLFTPLFFEVIKDRDKLMQWSNGEQLIIGGVLLPERASDKQLEQFLESPIDEQLLTTGEAHGQTEHPAESESPVSVLRRSGRKVEVYKEES